MQEKPKTGMYIRIKRGERWENLDIADVTDNEFFDYIQTLSPEKIKSWVLGLHKWIINVIDFGDNV